MFGIRLDQRGVVDTYASNRQNATYYNNSIPFFNLGNDINAREMPGLHDQLVKLYSVSGIPFVGKGPISNWAVGVYI